MLYINDANHQPMPSTHFTSVNTYIIHRNTSHDLNTGFQNQEPIRCQTINQVITIHITPNTHINNIQTLLTTIGESADDDSNIVSEDLEVHSKNFAYLEVMTFANLVRVYGSICVAKFNLQCNMQNVNAICKMAMYFCI